MSLVGASTGSRPGRIPATAPALAGAIRRACPQREPLVTTKITSPSRRTIAKGAAWAVPAVTVAATAPSLAASPTACAPGTLQVRVNCPGLVSGDSLYVTITNPMGSGCTIPTGTSFTVDRGGLAGVEVGPLNDLNVGADVLFDSATSGHLTAPLAPGDSVDVQIFPEGLATVSALQNLTFTIEGSSASQGYTIVRVGLVDLTIALCGLG